jgi:hypothetical protein
VDCQLIIYREKQNAEKRAIESSKPICRRRRFRAHREQQQNLVANDHNETKRAGGVRRWLGDDSSDDGEINFAAIQSVVCEVISPVSLVGDGPTALRSGIASDSCDDSGICRSSSPPTVTNWSITNSGLTGSFFYDSSDNGIDVTFTKVPEPGTWFAAALVLLATGYSQRRRFRRLVVTG